MCHTACTVFDIINSPDFLQSVYAKGEKLKEGEQDRGMAAPAQTSSLLAAKEAAIEHTVLYYKYTLFANGLCGQRPSALCARVRVEDAGVAISQ